MLFTEDPLQNLLPFDGEVYYHGPVLSPAEADRYFQLLLQQTAWQHDEVFLFGKRIVTNRKVAWYADQPFSYTYSKVTRHALPWYPELQELKALCEQHSGATYNSCLLNLYHNGQEGMSWHSDAERELVPGGAIASLSLGAERKFAFRHKQTAETRTVHLQHGSLLIMQGSTQQHWLHRLPPATRVNASRINLTFRKMQE
jgi:alkylated DNA repair dioxygenase AlkB